MCSLWLWLSWFCSSPEDVPVHEFVLEVEDLLILFTTGPADVFMCEAELPAVAVVAVVVEVALGHLVSAF